MQDNIRPQLRPQMRLKPPSASDNSLPPATPDLPSYQSTLTKKIMKLQAQNYNYQCQLEQLNQTLNKLTANSKANSKLKRSKTQLNTKLSSFKKQIENKNKFIEIKKKQLQHQKTKDQAIRGYDSLAEYKYQIQDKQKQLEEIKKVIKTLETQNKGAEQKLFQYSLKGKLKVSDVHITMMREILNQNQRLKSKLEKHQSTELKKQKQFLRKKNSSTELRKKPSLLLPEISSKKNLFDKRKSVGELGKLENERQIYTKFLEVRKPRKQQKLSQEIKEAQSKEEYVINKITTSQIQIEKIKQRIRQLKLFVTPERIQKAKLAAQQQKDLQSKLSNAATNCDLRHRTERRDWIGKFAGLRFSDSRSIRQQTRLCKIVYNDIGYYKFYYYPIRDPKAIISSPLTFDIDSANSGKQTTFRVQYPDYIKSIKVKINISQHLIVELTAVSNLGLIAEFPNQIGLTTGKISPEKRKSKTLEHHIASYVPPQEFTYYTFDIKSNEAPALMFGSYAVKYNQKRQLQKVCLEGLGVQIIQDYVQQLI